MYNSLFALLHSASFLPAALPPELSGACDDTQVLRLNQKTSAKNKVAARRELVMAACEIEQHLVQQGDFIAQGGQGEVYKAIYAGQLAAMKVVRVEGTLLRRQRIAMDFMQEVDITTRLRHPNIIQIYGVVTSGTKCLKVVMDYAPDGSLRDLLDQDPLVPLPMTTQLNYIKQLCYGIEYLHGSKVAHRDFKSLNVLRFASLCFVACPYKLYSTLD